jgi:hypothetical protein
VKGFTVMADEKNNQNAMISLFPSNLEVIDKFQSAYEELTGKSIKWKDIPKNLLNSFSCTSKPLSAKELVELPKNIRVAYLVSRKPPNNAILDKIKKRLVFYENKYGIPSEVFYRKHHNSESLYKGSPEQVNDFLLWHGDYRRYLELENAIC